MDIKNLTQETFDEEVMDCPLPVLVEFWARWCGHCRAFAPVIETVGENMHSTVKICKVEVDDNPELCSEYNIHSIPTMLFFKEGELVDTIEGAMDEDRLTQKLSTL